MSDADPKQPAAKGTCPICGKAAQSETAPFCSSRCRNVDLHRWLSGGYAIPGKPAEDEGDDPEA